MPLVHRSVTPINLSSTKLNLSRTDSEFIAVNNGTLVNVVRQLGSLVSQAGEIFLGVSVLSEEVGKRIRSIKLRLDELEVKAELFDPKLVPVPEGKLELEDAGRIPYKIRDFEPLDKELFLRRTRPKFLLKLYQAAGSHEPNIPQRSPITSNGVERRKNRNETEGSRPASIAALRDWKLDDYVDEKIATLDKKKISTPEELSRVLSKPFPSQVVSVDVTGSIFDRMKANRRSLIIHTKRIRLRKKRRNTICGGILPNKECGIQTSLSSVTSPSDTNQKKYGIDSGHWSSCSAQDGCGGPSSSSVPSPWDPNSCSTSSDFLFDDEDRSLTPQLENFTDGMVSDSDSVDTEGYFTSFRNECGFPKSKKNNNTKETDEITSPSLLVSTENEYELFGKGSTSTTASSCGTVVLRNKPEPPLRTTSAEQLTDKKDDAGWVERVKRKSLIERVPSLVVVTPSPSCPSTTPPPVRDCLVSDSEKSIQNEDGSETSKEGGHDGDDEITTEDSQSASGTLSDDTLSDSDNRLDEYKDGSCSELMRASSSSSTLSTASSENSTNTLTNCPTKTLLPQPDVIADVQQMVIRTKATPKLDIGQEYFSLDTVLLGSSSGEERSHHHRNSSGGESKMNQQAPLGESTSGKLRGARVVLDANGEIIFSSETLRRKRRHKVSFDPGNAVKPQDDSESTYSRVRESVYDRILKKDDGNNEKLYECIEEIRRHNLKESDAMYEGKLCIPILQIRESGDEEGETVVIVDRSIASRPRAKSPPRDDIDMTISAEVGSNNNTLLETDLDSAIPPVMPELKNLPKIKDRLKRNESYRIATDELPPRVNSHSPSSPPPQSSSPIKRISSGFINNDNDRKLKLNNNRKRDIQEEDPAFIQQVLSFSNNGKNLSEQRNFGEDGHGGMNRSITLSKFALSPEDRPSFLRRDSPPTMDEITKEIYRFRKKFNIQPNALSTKLCSSSSQDEIGSGVFSSRGMPRSISNPLPHKSISIPKPPQRKYFSPYSTSTPVKQSTSHLDTSSPLNFNYAKVVPPPPPPVVPTTTQSSSVGGGGRPYFSTTTRRIFSALKQKQSNNGGGTTTTTETSDMSTQPFQKSVSFALPKDANKSPSTSSTSTSPSRSPGTSLKDFKKLLQATKSNCKRSSISAVEILKPRFLGQETML